MAPYSVLVIDDEAAILEVVQYCLEDLSDWRVVVATSGQEGLAIAQSKQPDGILLDVTLPDMNGFEVVRRLRESATASTIPIVLLTARVEVKNQPQLAQHHISGVILKPFNPMELVEQVAAAFGWELSP